jgi:hypothetical protein
MKISINKDMYKNSYALNIDFSFFDAHNITQKKVKRTEKHPRV